MHSSVSSYQNHKYKEEEVDKKNYQQIGACMVRPNSDTGQWTRTHYNSD